MPVFYSSLGDTRHSLLNAGNLKCWAFGLNYFQFLITLLYLLQFFDARWVVQTNSGPWPVLLSCIT
jgi:hypothetical protein